MIRFVLAFTVIASAAQAQSIKLEVHEIDALLSGNTATGQWECVSYRQYFDPDGTTIYAEVGERSALGAWRIEGDEYQSLWQDGTWEGWLVMEFAGDLYWVRKSTPPTPFAMLEGQQLVAE